MADYVAVLSNLKLHMHGSLFEQPFLANKNSNFQIRRKYGFGSCKSINFSWLNVSKFIVSHSTNLQENLLKERTLKCYCFGALQNGDSALTPDWIPLFDQGLLMISMFLTYMAGVIPVEKPFSNAWKAISSEKVVCESSCYPGSAVKSDNDDNLQFAWEIVGKKLADSISAMKNGVDLGNRLTEIEQNYEKRPSSLTTLAIGPRLRLLWACFLWLKKEVHNIPEDFDTFSTDGIVVVCKGIVLNCCQPLCMTWLEEEFRLEKGKYEKALLSVSDNLNGYDNVLQNIKRSGKEDLYAELMCTLRFGSIWKSGYYGYNLFSLHGVNILEDLVITIADGVANMYLELISVDSSMSDEVNSLGLSLCTLSTRSLQKLRNEVALHQWLHQNIEAIASMYEDRFELFTLQTEFFDECSDRVENFKWWKKLTLKKSEPISSPLCFAVISHASVTVKRTKELRALTGWRYFFSLILELSDIAMPLIRTVIAKVSDAISFFLDCLIGRSLGLIYTGIRQSLRWK